MSRLTCAVCGIEWPSARARHSHEVRRHPEWAPTVEQRREQSRHRTNAWLERQPIVWRWIGWTNAYAKRRGLVPIPRDAQWPMGPCHYCGGEQTGWDHVVALARGGTHTLDNLVPCCKPCNQRKHANPADSMQTRSDGRKGYRIVEQPVQLQAFG